MRRFTVLLIAAGLANGLSINDATASWHQRLSYRDSYNYRRIRTNDPAVPPEGGQAYGSYGRITRQRATTVRGLINQRVYPDRTGYYRFAQSQSRRAITRRLGFGTFENREASYYRYGNGWMQVTWNSQGQATGVRYSLDLYQR